MVGTKFPITVMCGVIIVFRVESKIIRKMYENSHNK